MEERSSSLGSCELTDEHNTTTNSDDCQKPLVLTFLDVENEPEGGEFGIEEEGPEIIDGYKCPQIQEAPGPSAPFQFFESSESVLFRKDSEPVQPRGLASLFSHRRSTGVEKEDLPPNAVLTTSPSLLASYLPRLRLGSLSGFPASCDTVKKWKKTEEMSRPRKQWGTPDRKLFWGNQDPIRPISEAALKAQLSRRLEDLAQPKLVSRHYVPNRAQYYYSCGRESVIWEIPPRLQSTRPSKRIQKLAKPNKFKLWSLPTCDHPVPGTFRFADPSPRFCNSPKPKAPIPTMSLQRAELFTVRTAATPSTNKVTIKDNLESETFQLRQENSQATCVHLAPEAHEIAPAALLARPSDRTTILAKSKPVHEDYLPARDPRWPVSYAAAHSQVSDRVRELAHPPTRASVHIVYYDPDVFKVKPAALKAQCSPRVKELAEPILR